MRKNDPPPPLIPVPGIPAAHPNGTTGHGGGHSFLGCYWVVYSKKGQINMFPETKSMHRQWLNSSINQPEALSHPQNTHLFEVAPHSSQGIRDKVQGQGRGSVLPELAELCTICGGCQCCWYTDGWFSFLSLRADRMPVTINERS